MPRALFITALALTLSAASPALATVVEALDLPGLIAGADLVVHGTVLDVGTRFDRRHARPETVVRLRVRERWLGEGEGDIALRELGGTSGGRSVRIAGSARYGRGEEVVVFLERRPEAPRDLRTAGMAQGKLTVQRPPGGPPTVHRDLRDLVRIDPHCGRPDSLVTGGAPCLAPPGELSGTPLAAVRARVLAHARSILTGAR